MKAAHFPAAGHNLTNPYIRLLQEHLEHCGVESEHTSQDRLTAAWLRQKRGEVQVLHLHFPRGQYARGSRVRVRLAADFIGGLWTARRLGYTVVWTMHNLYPHERPRPHGLDYLARLALAQRATHVIVHCEHGRHALRSTYLRRRNVHVLDHPGFVGCYPNTVSREEARSRLGLSTAKTVFLCLGLLRPYKGLDRLIQAFADVPGDELALVIAGQPRAGISETGLLAAAHQDRRIRVYPRRVEDGELQTFFNAADMAVLPFRKVLASGSAMLAMSFGCPVLAPSLGCLPESVTKEAAVLYNAAEPGGLRDALAHALTLDTGALGRQAYERAARFTFAEMARQTAEIYRLG